VWQKRQTDLLEEEIEAVLSPLFNYAELYSIVREALTKPGRCLAEREELSRPWFLLPMVVCEAICGEFKKALPLAASRQIFSAAADVFDDIEDADSTISVAAKYGPAIATNTATTLLFLAERALSRLSLRNIKEELIIRITDAVNSFYITACTGQHLDLSPGSETATSEEFYLKLTDMKSASQVECSCYAGALLAGANPNLIAKLATFGHNLGMADQIANDLQGITRGVDIEKRKLTLPIIYAINQTEGQTFDDLNLFFIHKSDSKLSPAQVKKILFDTGAIHFTMVRMEYFKQLALENLNEATTSGASTGKLKIFLE
jgi:geranylgeranyl diphosphate synthase, type I